MDALGACSPTPSSLPPSSLLPLVSFPRSFASAFMSCLHPLVHFCCWDTVLWPRPTLARKGLIQLLVSGHTTLLREVGRGSSRSCSRDHGGTLLLPTPHSQLVLTAQEHLQRVAVSSSHISQANSPQRRPQANLIGQSLNWDSLFNYLSASCKLFVKIRNYFPIEIAWI